MNGGERRVAPRRYDQRMSDESAVEALAPEAVVEAPRVPWQKRPLTWMLAAAAIVVAAALIVGGVALFAPRAFTVKGALVLTDSGVLANGGTCQYYGDGYSDIEGGASVSIRDAAGKTIGLGSLLKGKSVGDNTCAFFFTIKDVPDGEKFYGVEVTHRGVVQYTPKQMKAGPVMSLGDGG